MPIEFGDILVYVVTLFGIYTALFFIITLFQGRQAYMEMTNKKLKWKPKVCIIVPCFNEEKTVGKTLESLLKLDYPKKLMDIIVVDDGSSDNTYKVASKYKKQGVRVFRKKNGGKYTALNLGLKKTNAEVAGALDADSFVHSNALKKMMPYFEEDDVMAVTPSMKIYKAKNWLQRVQMIEYIIGIFLRKVFALLGSVHVAPGPFTLYKTEFFKEHGGYKKAYLTEDIEMALRIQALHYQIENTPDAYVHTIGPSTFKNLYKQRLRWYFGFIQNVLEYKSLFSKQHGNLGMFILPASFISVFLVIITLFYTLYKLIESLWKRYIFLKAIDFDFMQMLEFNFDTFFLNFNEAMILSLFTIALSVCLIILAKKVASEEDKIKYSYIIYILVYWVLFGFWWIVAFYYKLSNKKTRWGHKSSG
ncbi:glycosyltransferase [Nanoarchaeota archaeon]